MSVVPLADAAAAGVALIFGEEQCAADHAAGCELVIGCAGSGIWHGTARSDTVRGALGNAGDVRVSGGDVGGIKHAIHASSAVCGRVQHLARL